MERNFNALERTATQLAQELYGGQSITTRLDKFDEECKELAIAFKEGNKGNMRDEASDLLFVLNDIANRLDTSLYDLLHAATVKNIQRMRDPNFGRDTK